MASKKDLILDILHAATKSPEEYVKFKEDRRTTRKEKLKKSEEIETEERKHELSKKLETHKAGLKTKSKQKGYALGDLPETPAGMKVKGLKSVGGGRFEPTYEPLTPEDIAERERAAQDKKGREKRAKEKEFSDKVEPTAMGGAIGTGTSILAKIKKAHANRNFETKSNRYTGTPASGHAEGTEIVNRKTGEKMIVKGGKWQPQNSQKVSK